MRRSNLVLGAYLLAVFLSGGVVGFFVHHLYSLESVKAKAAPRDPDDYRHKYGEEMRSRLTVKEEQVQQLNAILDSTRLRYREFPESAHMMRPQDWEEATRDAAEWLVRFVSSEAPRRARR
mgnify:CR=1 FL=1